jgi:superfamily II DNA helicase RecQ
MKTQTEDLNKSIDSLIEEFFAEPVQKADNLNIAGDSKTTADAAIASAPKAQNDDSRGAGRPKQISDVPENDEDGKRDGQYDASIAAAAGEEENPEAKKQSRSIDQTSSAGRMGEAPKMKDPRLSKSDLEELEAFRKAKAEADSKAEELRKSEEIKKSEDLKKAELENLVKSAVASAIAPIQKENQELKKSLGQSEALIKAMAAQPQRAKSVTGIDAIEKSNPESVGPQEFTKADKLDAAERLVMKKSLPMDAVVELENTGTVYNKEWQRQIEAELQKPS